MRNQLRMVVLGVVSVVIVVAWIVEPPGTVEGVGFAVVLATMLWLIARERKKLR